MKKLAKWIAITVGVMMLGGCAVKDAMPELTDEQKEELAHQAVDQAAETKEELTEMKDSLLEDAADMKDSILGQAQGLQDQMAAEEAMGQAGSDQNITAAGEKISEGADGLAGTFSGAMGLMGSWQDEVSQRAMMEVSRVKDQTYLFKVTWGGSATESAVWEIEATYDEASGMANYSDGKYYILTVDENGKETISGEESTSGAFMKEGEKLRWQDSKNVAGGVETPVFVKP